jgi:hypothetical protein
MTGKMKLGGIAFLHCSYAGFLGWFCMSTAADSGSWFAECPSGGWMMGHTARRTVEAFGLHTLFALNMRSFIPPAE